MVLSLKTRPYPTETLSLSRVSSSCVRQDTPLSHPYSTCKCGGGVRQHTPLSNLIPRVSVVVGCVRTHPYLTLIPRVSVVVVCQDTPLSHPYATF